MDELNEQWQVALGELQLQMTQATYDTWLRGSRVVGREDGTVTVAVRHAYAVDWLENRLMRTIMRSARRHLPGVERVVFQAGAVADEAERATTEGRPYAEVETPEAVVDGIEGEVDISTVRLPELVAFEQMANERIRKRGFAQLTNYALRFWAELLGPSPFLCWTTAFAHDRRDKRGMVGLSQPVRFSIARLARVAANGRVQAVRGVWRKCRHQEMEGLCCGRHEDRLVRIGADGACRYWQPGAFDVLREERVGVVYVNREGRWQEWDPTLEGVGRALRRQRYRLQVYVPLPLLTPAQVARLDAVSQDEHEGWLNRAGLDVEEWERLTVDSFGMLSLSGGAG